MKIKVTNYGKLNTEMKLGSREGGKRVRIEIFTRFLSSFPPQPLLLPSLLNYSGKLLQHA